MLLLLFTSVIHSCIQKTPRPVLGLCTRCLSSYKKEFRYKANKFWNLPNFSLGRVYKFKKQFLKIVVVNLKGYKHILFMILAYILSRSFKFSLMQLFCYSFSKRALSSVQFTQSCPDLCDPMKPSTPGLPVYHQLPESKPMSIELVMPSNHLILWGPLLFLPSIFPSIRVFSNESALCIRWPKYWSFSFNISPSNEHPGLISFRMDRLDLLAVQGTLKHLLQHHSSKASILRPSAFFIVQLSHPYMTTGKTQSLDYMDLCWQSYVSAFEYAI